MAHAEPGAAPDRRQGRTVTEEAWQHEGNAEKLLRLLPSDFSRRKLRHFTCASVRGQLGTWCGIEAERILAFAEQIADDEANVDADKWVVIYQELRERWEPDFDGQLATLLTWTVNEDIYEGACWLVDEKTDVANEQAAALLRDIFGNPFRPVAFPLEWRTSTAIALAAQMYESRDFSAMPILGDALQDAGCDNAGILDHCRGLGPHVRGCWVVDLVLGKE